MHSHLFRVEISSHGITNALFFFKKPDAIASLNCCKYFSLSAKMIEMLAVRVYVLSVVGRVDAAVSRCGYVHAMSGACCKREGEE